MTGNVHAVPNWKAIRRLVELGLKAKK